MAAATRRESASAKAGVDARVAPPRGRAIPLRGQRILPVAGRPPVHQRAQGLPRSHGPRGAGAAEGGGRPRRGGAVKAGARKQRAGVHPRPQDCGWILARAQVTGRRGRETIRRRRPMRHEAYIAPHLYRVCFLGLHINTVIIVVILVLTTFNQLNIRCCQKISAYCIESRLTLAAATAATATS